MLKMRMLRSGFRPAWMHKLRAMFMMLSVMVGIAALTVILSLGKGTEEKIMADERQVNTSAEQITRILRERHSINANEDDDFMVITPVRVKEIIDEATRTFNLYLPILAVVALLVGGIVVVNLMLISVSERVKEIGLRKAVGAKSKDMAMQFLIEASSITIFSGLAGIIVGILLLTKITKLMNLPFTISWSALLACCAISALTGIAAGFFPAKKAASLSPVESLR